MARTHEALAAVHGTLDRVADRLTTIEKNISSGRELSATGESDILELTQIADAASTHTPKPEGRPLELIARAPTTASAHVVPDASPAGSTDVISRITRQTEIIARTRAHSDQPLEPGSGRPGSSAIADLRIAVSEAALGAARPGTPGPASKSSFIAAARRAAQAAGQDPKNRQARSEPSRKSDDVPLRAKVRHEPNQPCWRQASSRSSWDWSRSRAISSTLESSKQLTARSQSISNRTRQRTPANSRAEKTKASPATSRRANRQRPMAMSRRHYSLRQRCRV